jgi:hypothetical protein
MRNVRTWGLVVIWTAISVFPACGEGPNQVLIPRTKIQEMVNRKFPYDKNAIMARVTLRSPVIYFAGNSIGMKLEYYGSFLTTEIQGTVNFTGQLSYNPDSGAFYLNDFKIVDIQANDKNFAGVEGLKTLVGNFVNSYLTGYPVYRLDPDDFKQNMAKRFLKDVSVKGENLAVTLSI